MQNDDSSAPQYRKLACRVVDITCGQGVTIVEPANLYGCTLEDGVFVGPFVEVQRNAVIGARTRIQSHSFICEKVTIGTDCFIGHGVMFINDLFKDGHPTYDVDAMLKTCIGNHVSIGSNATILPVTICDHTVIGAGAVVTKAIATPGIYAGNPARLIRPL